MGPFRLCFHERSASPCGLTAKATKGFKRGRMIVKKEKRVFHGFRGITAMLQKWNEREESMRRKRRWLCLNYKKKKREEPSHILWDTSL